MPAVVEAASHPDAQPVVADSGASAVLVIGAAGNVIASNESAQHLWACSEQSLVDASVARLFGLAQPGDNGESLLARWRSLKPTLLNRWSTLQARTFEGCVHEIRVRIERAFGGAGSYIAIIEPLGGE